MDEIDLVNEGLEYFNKGDFKVCLSMFNSAIKMNPNCKEAHLNKGIVLNALNKMSEAIESFEYCLKLSPNYTSALIGLGNSYLKLEDYKTALTYFENALKLKNNLPLALQGKCICLYELKNKEEANKIINELNNDNNKEESKDIIQYLIKGNMAKDENNFQEAINCYDKCLELNNNSYEAYYNKALCEIALNQNDNAIKNLDNALNIQKDFPQALDAKGCIFYSNNQFAEALKCYNELASKYNTNDDYHFKKASTLVELKQYDEAIKSFDETIKLNPNNIKAMKRISYMLIQEGLLLEALIYLKKVRKIDRDEPAILKEIEECQQLISYKRELDDNKIINDWNKCYELSSKLIKKCPKCFDIKLIYLESMVNSYQIEEALNYYKNDFNQNEKQLENVQILIIKAYFNDGKYEKSKQLLLNYLSNAKDSNLIEKIKKLSDKLEQIESLKEKANNYYKENNFTEAINVYNELLSLDNNNKIFNALILSNRSLCYYKMRDLFNALHDINASIKLNDKYWKSFQRRANINIRLKYSEQAKDDLRRVLELDPSNKEARKLLEDILKEERKKGNKDLYTILGVSQNATFEEIRKEYKKLAFKWHPDRNGETEEKKIFAEKKFKEINAAYNILFDPNKRDIYDKTGKETNFEQKYETRNDSNDNKYNDNKRERSRDKEEYMKDGFHY